jgi:peptide/nickel transport system substrate-binding protein
MGIKRIPAILLCCVTLFSIAACNTGNNNANSTVGTNTPNTAPSGRDTLNVAVSQDYGTISPAYVAASHNTVFGALIAVQEPMWDFTETEEVIWLLATSIDVLSPTHWTVHLREGIEFSNGSPFTASDVIFSLDITRNSGSLGSPRSQEVNLENTTATDDYTIDMNWDQFHISQMQILSDMAIYDEESYDPETANTNPIGTGPYKVTEYVVNSHCFFERRDDYWGEPPAIKYLKFNFVSETSQIVNGLEAGTLDMGTISTQDYDYVSSLSGVDIMSHYSATWARVSFNVNEPSIMHNAEARYALCHAVDSDAIINLVYDGFARRMYSPVSMAATDYEDRFDNLDGTYSAGYDLDLAKQYAESSGLTGKEIRIITNGLPAFVTIAEIIQGALSQIGVTAVIQNYDTAGYQVASYDPAMFDVAISGGICPGLIVAGPLINGVRYSSLLSAPGSWDGVERYLEFAPQGFYNPDIGKHGDITYEILQMYTKACLTYGICDIEDLIAIPQDLPGPFIWRSGGGIRFADMAFAS